MLAVLSLSLSPSHVSICLVCLECAHGGQRRHKVSSLILPSWNLNLASPSNPPLSVSPQCWVAVVRGDHTGLCYMGAWDQISGPPSSLGFSLNH